MDYNKQNQNQANHNHLHAHFRPQNGYPVPMQMDSPLGPRPMPGNQPMLDVEGGAVIGPGGARMRRQNTLTRPERQRSFRKPMLRSPNAAPPAARVGATTHRPATLPRPSDAQIDEEEEPFDCWVFYSRAMTICFFPVCMRWFGMHDPKVQQAWREKVTLVLIILIMCVALGYLTFGFRATVCSSSSQEEAKAALSYYDNNGKKAANDYVTAFGLGYDYSVISRALSNYFPASTLPALRGTDITLLFGAKSDACDPWFQIDANSCTVTSTYDKTALRPNNGCIPPNVLNGLKVKGRIAFEWSQVQDDNTKFVYNGAVIDVNVAQNNGGANLVAASQVPLSESLGRDGTKQFMYSSTTHRQARCFSERFLLGFVDKETPGCFASNVVTIVSLIVILGVVMTRFFMAVTFSWFLSKKLSKSKSPACAAAVTPGTKLPKHIAASPDATPYASDMSLALTKNDAVPYPGPVGAVDDVYTIMLVTCYSEGETGIRQSMDSLAMTEYPDDKKLLFFVADGLITGSGNDRSTPDIILSLYDVDLSHGDPAPMSYLAIADGAKQHNMARIYAGYYNKDGRKIPCVTIVKCGTPAEAKTAKPGNRGKRDSQLVLMNFLSRVMFDDRMTPFDYDLFNKIQSVAGVTPDKYEIILMVDADTVVMSDSMRHMINAMKNDQLIMGLCGETKIANKTTSFTTAIQVFEYYISHHLGKAFESVFGGVTCLPGCFCMYRIKARKGPSNHWVPILVNPDIVEEYSENVVETLHTKNLLLLGEDRFLTTLMLRNFPKRKMMFVPKAICKTVVPDEFKVLLSQRRRWINSTIHNLLELVLVRDLCGIFCFSMQFVVMLELIGTVVLPAAICFTIYLIVVVSVSADPQVLPLLMLAAILGLPGVLILITSRKLVYIGWMLIYLLALPIWNFVLPVYAFWHFDDFSWGETRKVEGETGGDSHGKKEGVFDANAVVLKRWSEWEKDRRLSARQSNMSGHGSVNGSTSTLYSSQPGSLPQTVSVLPSNAVPVSLPPNVVSMPLPTTQNAIPMSTLPPNAIPVTANARISLATAYASAPNSSPMASPYTRMNPVMTPSPVPSYQQVQKDLPPVSYPYEHRDSVQSNHSASSRGSASQPPRPAQKKASRKKATPSPATSNSSTPTPQLPQISTTSDDGFPLLRASMIAPSSPRGPRNMQDPRRGSE